MIGNDAAIVSHAVENWTLEIADYIDRDLDAMIARDVLVVRNVGADVAFDNVINYDRTGPGAQITAKGAVPKSMGLSATSTPYEIFQISTGFNLSEKDMKLDPSVHNRLVDIAIHDIHRAEDNLVLNGISRFNILGLAGAAQANANGKIVAAGASGHDSNNKGAWTGEGSTDIYDDMNTARGKMDGEFDPAFLLGKRTDMYLLDRMDANRTPYSQTISRLFRKKSEDLSWIKETGHLAGDKVYLIPKHFMAGELIVSENPTIKPLYNGGLGPGSNYYFEINEWVVPEFHNNDAFVEIEIT